MAFILEKTINMGPTDPGPDDPYTGAHILNVGCPVGTWLGYSRCLCHVMLSKASGTKNIKTIATV